ncbi:MAG: DUF1273 domain-containing protein [Clostridiales bacterium]|nr:DUF1273 domain-containing protein [Clostridiales bacterium]
MTPLGRGIKTASFTGHRLQKLPFGFDESSPGCRALKARLAQAIEGLIGEGYGDFISGGSLGSDLFAAEAVIALREKYPWARLEVAVPFPGQADRWSPAYRARYDDMLRQADRRTLISPVFDKGSLFRRNRYLVDRCDCLLAVYGGLPGGTRFTVEYARQAGRRILTIEPGSGASSA